MNLLPSQRMHFQDMAKDVNARPAAWRSVVANLLVPRESLDALKGEFDRQTIELHAAALKPIADLAKDVHAAIPAPPIYRPKDAADAARINGEVSEILHRTPRGITLRLEQARAENDVALLTRMVPLVEDRMEFSKPLAGNAPLLAGLVTSKQFLAEQPEVVARTQAIEQAEQLDREIGLLAHVLLAPDSAEQLAVYRSTGSFPLLEPPAENPGASLPEIIGELPAPAATARIPV